MKRARAVIALSAFIIAIAFAVTAPVNRRGGPASEVRADAEPVAYVPHAPAYPGPQPTELDWNRIVAAADADAQARWYAEALRQKTAADEARRTRAANTPKTETVVSGEVGAASVADQSADSPPQSGSVEDAVRQYFGDIFQQAWNVSDCESTHDPTAIGGNNYGLFQISDVQHADAFEAVTGVSFRKGWSDPFLNSQYARHLYNESGWGPWGCRWAARKG